MAGRGLDAPRLLVYVGGVVARQVGHLGADLVHGRVVEHVEPAGRVTTQEAVRPTTAAGVRADLVRPDG